MAAGKTLLVNYWYAPSVGHAIEGMRYALGYKTAMPDLSVSVLLNGATAIELAGCCDFIDDVYAVPYTGFLVPETDPVTALVNVPASFDWVVENPRVHLPSHQALAGFRAFFDAAHDHFRPRHPLGVIGLQPPDYAPNQDLRLELPAPIRARAAKTIGEAAPVISVLLAGSSAPRSSYPSGASWELILGALAQRYPSAALLLIGKYVEDGRTTSRVGRREVDRLFAAVPSTVDCFDRPLLEQVALIERSDLLVSPHMGFAFVASTVGTPWLAISGGDWHEYFFNGELVYSLLPDPDRYPAFLTAGSGSESVAIIEQDDDGEGPRAPSMSIARLRDDLPEMVQASELLIERRLSYDDALSSYFPRLLAAYRGDRSRPFAFDNIGARYLPLPG